MGAGNINAADEEDEMICEHCTDDLRTFRLGRAHYACMECGKDVTMHLVCLQMAGIDISAIPVVTLADFRPITDNEEV